MRSYLWCLVLPAFLNCSGQNVVAGKDKTRAEKLESSLPGWCKSACSRLEQCEQDNGCDCSGDVCECTGVDDDCPEDCEEELSRWAGGSEACALVGERVMKCIDDLGCDALGANGGDCNPTAEERDACPKAGDSPQEPGDPGGPPAEGGAPDGPAAYGGSLVSGPGYGGGASVGGAPSVGAAPSVGGSMGVGGGGLTGTPVTCTARSSSGQAGSANSPTVCQEGSSECSDAHDYEWYCVQTAPSKRVCSCLVDGSLTRAFEWNDSCPAVVQVNVACGWSLVGE